MAERLLPAGFRIVLPEPRGCGESVGPLEGVTLRDLAADVAGSIESVGGAPVVLAGHAFGNRVARMLSADRPDLVRGVVLMASGGKFPPRPKRLEIYECRKTQICQPSFASRLPKQRYLAPKVARRRPI